MFNMPRAPFNLTEIYAAAAHTATYISEQAKQLVISQPQLGSTNHFYGHINYPVKKTTSVGVALLAQLTANSAEKTIDGNLQADAQGTQGWRLITEMGSAVAKSIITEPLGEIAKNALETGRLTAPTLCVRAAARSAAGAAAVAASSLLFKTVIERRGLPPSHDAAEHEAYGLR
jgi:hypothetical protein